jgi:Ca2+-binding RTX toxin-like protein
MAIINGTDGDDSRAGGSGDDIIRGLAGRDTLFGNDGDDRIYGENEDVFTGGPTSEEDTIYGGTGNDTLAAGDDNDTVIGGAGDDFMGGGIDDDTLSGDHGDDTMVGGRDDDIVLGQTGDDTLSGNDGNDILGGGGSLSFDTLYGGTGNDLLAGDGGRDLLTGGSGADRFSFNSRLVSGQVRYDSDVLDPDQIRDFDRDEDDIINVSLIDADLTAAGNQAFTWTGVVGSPLKKGELGYFDSRFVRSVVANTDDDAAIDFAIDVDNGRAALFSSDFIL